VIGPMTEPVVIPRPVGMALVVVVIPGSVGMALMVVVMFELVVIARLLVMALVILEPLVMAEPEVMALVVPEPLVMHLVVVVTAEPVVNALVLPLALVIVVLARYVPEQPMVPNQPVRYLIFALYIYILSISEKIKKIKSNYFLTRNRVLNLHKYILLYMYSYWKKSI
jgi:hypothetical protein